MSSWVDKEPHHIDFFERKCLSLGLSVSKSRWGHSCYDDPEVEQLWVFYRLGVEQENQEWQKDC